MKLLCVIQGGQEEACGVMPPPGISHCSPVVPPQGNKTSCINVRKQAVVHYHNTTKIHLNKELRNILLVIFSTMKTENVHMPAAPAEFPDLSK